MNLMHHMDPDYVRYITTESFISEIEKQPCIWDQHHVDYSDKKVKKLAWDYVIVKFVPDFEEKDDIEKESIAASFHRKWKGLRNSFSRELAKKIKEVRSGSASSYRKEYVYFNLLRFLKPSTKDSTTGSFDESSRDDELDGENEEEKDDEKEDIDFVQCDMESLETETPKPTTVNRKRCREASETEDKFHTVIGDLGSVETESPKPTTINRKRRRVTSETDERFQTVIGENFQQRMNFQSNEHHDEDRLFMLSLVQELKKIPDQRKLEVKCELMNVFKKARTQDLYYNRNQGLGLATYSSATRRQSHYGNMTASKVVLLACGSYNPPTNMHLRMFEIARDHLHRMNHHVVVGGLVSPVHDAYGKKDLEASNHRLSMVRLALQNSDWIKVSDWECRQETWTPTRQVLQYYQNRINELMHNSKNNTQYDEVDNISWAPEFITSEVSEPVKLKLLCGADLLESFGTPGLWKDEDIEAIVGQHGLVVITRSKNNPLEFIYNSDVLSKYQSNITIVTEWITNEISSTKIRRALRRSDSVKYLLPDSVIDYIKRNNIYSTKQT